MNNQKIFYPLGTVVTTTIKPNPVVIIGRMVREQPQDDIIYDYVAVDYIMGIQSQENISYFDNDDITGILFIGMQNDAELDFQQFLSSIDKKDY